MQKLRGPKNSIAILAPCGGGWNVAAIGNVTKEIFFNSWCEKKKQCSLNQARGGGIHEIFLELRE